MRSGNEESSSVDASIDEKPVLGERWTRRLDGQVCSMSYLI